MVGGAAIKFTRKHKNKVQELINDCQVKESSPPPRGKRQRSDSLKSDSPSESEGTDASSGDHTVLVHPQLEAQPVAPKKPVKPSGRKRTSAEPVARVAGKRRGHPTVSVGRPHLAEEWHPSKNTKRPDEVTLGSEYRAWWVCKQDSSHPAWQVRVEKRALKGKGGCPACHNAEGQE